MAGKVKNLNPMIESQAEYWSKGDIFDETTRAEIQKVLDSGDACEIEERFYKDLEFGTGGLRGILGAGSSRMNKYNVRRASYAFGRYLNKVHGGKSVAVAISYDSRHFSREFAREASQVFAALGLKVILTSDMRPVPMLSFMVRYFNCQGGVCITASHNPPEYNGYKVYWETGGQIVPPHDQGVIDLYKLADSFESIPMVDFEAAISEGKIRIVSDELDEPYLEKVAQLSVNDKGKSDLKIVYTPIHGTGLKPVKAALERFGFSDVHIVKEQAMPDGGFPTVKSPNPESPEALAMAVDNAKRINADLVLGTDPDCDRIGVVVFEKGREIFLNGNQLGSLLVDYVLRSWSEHGRLPENPLVIKTIVTTDLQQKIAAFYGASCEETLTGFKWICQLIEDYQSGALGQVKNYVCGGEESFGFLAGDFVRDKDAVIACAIAAEMTAYYKARGKTLIAALDDLFLEHGVYHEVLETVTLPGKAGSEKIASLMHELRCRPPAVIDGIPVVLSKDYEKSRMTSFKAGKFEHAGDISLPKSNVLQFILQDNTKVSIRPSGTEPKIKFYVSSFADVPELAEGNLEEVKEQCKAKAEAVARAFVAMTGI